MYHEERLINGIMHWRNEPNGEWTAYTLEELSVKYEQLRNRQGIDIRHVLFAGKAEQISPEGNLRAIDLEKFLKAYNEQVKQFSDCYTSLHNDIINHIDIRSHCYEVIKRMIVE